jgi:hypothetical protein
MKEITAIFFSCRRIGLLHQTVSAFMRANTYPIKEIIIVNDSGDEMIHELLRESYPDFTLVLHPENVGLIRSIDLGYEHIKTEYFFHCEDDWCFTGKGGFIEKSLAVMELEKNIEEVWLFDHNDCNGHPIELEIISAYGVNYQMVKDNWNLGDAIWHGFTTAVGLKRMSDYRKVGPYEKIPWGKTIWHRECAIGEAYHRLGYRTAILSGGGYVYNIGRGESEYKTGYEK